MKFIYRNWTVHNIVGHPLSEIAYLILLRGRTGERVCNWIHDITLPHHRDQQPKEQNNE